MTAISLALDPGLAIEAAPAPSAEAPFEVHELFFSRTDAAGIIQAGNDVFQRVSAYEWDELIGKPHKIVRHPDTPRAVFWLLWDTIRQGRPIGAYVKNRAKDGRHYWVFAIVTPVDGGYLSVRLKPTSPLLAVVKQEYAALAAAERAEGIAPPAAAAALLLRLGELGFADYPSFMSAALGQEIAARDKALGRQPDATGAMFEALSATAQSLLRQSEIIASAFASYANVPFNFRVLAAQLGREGAAISIISGNYGALSAEMQRVLARFVAAAQDVFRTINDGFFLLGTARMQRELRCFFAEEESEGEGGTGQSREREMALLDAQQRAYRAKALDGLREISRTAVDFEATCVEMNRLAAGLEVTRVMGKVECARHTHARDRMDELLGDLETFQRTIAAALKEIDTMNRDIQSRADGLLIGAAA